MQNFTLFQKFADSCLKNDPFFLISRTRASHWKNTPFFAKMGTSVVYVLVGSGGAGALSHQIHTRYPCKSALSQQITPKPGFDVIITCSLHFVFAGLAPPHYVSVNKTCCHISIARHQRYNIPKHLIIWFCCLSVYPSICRHTITSAFTEILLEL